LRLVDEGARVIFEELHRLGGDIVTGAATVISAMGAGKKTTKAIHQYLTKKDTK